MRLFFFIFISLSLSLEGSEILYKDLVLGEIQATLVKDYGVSNSFWENAEKSSESIKKTTDHPENRTQKKKSALSEKKGFDIVTYKKRKRRPLIDNIDDNAIEPPKKDLEKFVYKKKKRLPFDKKESSPFNHSKDPFKNKEGDWLKKSAQSQLQWQKKSTKEKTRWEKEKKAMLKSWEKDKKKFFKRLPVYKKNHVYFSSFASTASTSKISGTPQKLKVKFGGEGAVVVPHAFVHNVKDQGKRPTCSAFASTRALEISLAQLKNEGKKLSEQYIYYASRPRCQSSPCKKKGSWGLHALKSSTNSHKLDIPSEKSCPYSRTSILGNETQIPLKNGCFKGEHKVEKYYEVSSLGEIIKALNAGNPVISAFKLSPNFYKNKGVVFSRDALGIDSKKDHSAGHAILIIGHMKLPPQLNEGEFCLIVANSWGTGWGKGGHACLSKNWVNKYRFNIPFLAVDKVI